MIVKGFTNADDVGDAVGTEGVDIGGEGGRGRGSRKKDTKRTVFDEREGIRGKNTTATETFFLAGVGLREDVLEVAQGAC